jgi:hypothetical protein
MRTSAGAESAGTDSADAYAAPAGFCAALLVLVNVGSDRGGCRGYAACECASREAEVRASAQLDVSAAGIAAPAVGDMLSWSAGR